MRGVLLAGSIALIVLLTPISASGQDSDSLPTTSEIGDAPDFLWGQSEIEGDWQGQIIFVNFEIIGVLSENDSVDVFALKISSENGSRVQISPSGEANFQIQALNQTDWSIEGWGSVNPIADGQGEDTAEVNLTKGFHSIRIERIGDGVKQVNYSFRLDELEKIEIEEGDFEDLSWMFTEFYVIVGLMLISPLLLVIWWNKGRWIGTKSSIEEVIEHERARLVYLRKRFSKGNGRRIGVGALERSLESMKDATWESIYADLGEPEIMHHTENSEIRVWTTGEEGKGLLIGIRTRGPTWEMAAIRVYSGLGKEVEVISVSPECIFSGDEIFLGNIVGEKMHMLEVEISEIVREVRFHLSGVSGGVPIASSPVGSIGFEEE
jgi:hypothetical protein